MSQSQRAAIAASFLGTCAYWFAGLLTRQGRSQQTQSHETQSEYWFDLLSFFYKNLSNNLRLCLSNN